VTHHYFTAKLALGMKSLIVGAVTAMAAVIIDERTHIPLGPTIAVLVSVCGIVYWIGRTIQKLTDEIKDVRFDIKDVKIDMGELSKRMNSLPCVTPKNECGK
jgi:hypothetical protein